MHTEGISHQVEFVHVNVKPTRKLLDTTKVKEFTDCQMYIHVLTILKCHTWSSMLTCFITVWLSGIWLDSLDTTLLSCLWGSMGFTETVGRVGVAGVCLGFPVYHFIISGLPLKTELLLTALVKGSQYIISYTYMSVHNIHWVELNTDINKNNNYIHT